MVGGGWQVSGSAIRLSTVTRPSMCGVFVYRDETSIDASTHSCFNQVHKVRCVFNERGKGLYDWLEPDVKQSERYPL